MLLLRKGSLLLKLSELLKSVFLSVFELFETDIWLSYIFLIFLNLSLGNSVFWCFIGIYLFSKTRLDGLFVLKKSQKLSMFWLSSAKLSICRTVSADFWSMYLLSLLEKESHISLYWLEGNCFISTNFSFFTVLAFDSLLEFFL